MSGNLAAWLKASAITTSPRTCLQVWTNVKCFPGQPLIRRTCNEHVACNRIELDCDGNQGSPHPLKHSLRFGHSPCTSTHTHTAEKSVWLFLCPVKCLKPPSDSTISLSNPLLIFAESEHAMITLSTAEARESFADPRDFINCY